MNLKIYKPQYLLWWSRLYNIYKITVGSVLLIDGNFYNIREFDWKLSVVNIDGNIKKIGIRRVRKYRYAALKKRGTICNRIKPNNRYRFDIKDLRRCDPCFIRARCSLVSMGWRKRTQLAIKDVMLISQYFRDNEE